MHYDPEKQIAGVNRATVDTKLPKFDEILAAIWHNVWTIASTND